MGIMWPRGLLSPSSGRVKTNRTTLKNKTVSSSDTSVLYFDIQDVTIPPYYISIYRCYDTSVLYFDIQGVTIPPYYTSIYRMLRYLCTILQYTGCYDTSVLYFDIQSVTIPPYYTSIYRYYDSSVPHFNIQDVTILLYHTSVYSVLHHRRLDHSAASQ